ncbi:uncharacterized protein C7orf57 homolog [Nematolebias whitei]|uniref:uncharacterized protein C7orf57 homolog n=1 Tax=Nematolebias whitei TaxID=451745 RepID=UPI00189A69A5|nr:uncharacterized protein C7orf57 homolog [Nematolebias whitei]
MSNDLQPGISGVKEGCQTPDGYISQIPGLSPSVVSCPEERARGKRVTVQESDSDYVKLAKQGGHKGLLWHEDEETATSTSNTNSYKPPNWFSASSEDTIKQNKEEKNPGALQPLVSPFWTDSMSTWERGGDSSNEKEKTMNVLSNQMEELKTSSLYETSKYKRLVFDKRPEPVDMAKLLSFGYAEGNKPGQ